MEVVRVVRQYLFCAGLATWALLMYALLVTAVRSGDALRASFYVLAASPLLLAALALTLEERKLGELVNLKTGSWAFLLGDTVALTAAAGFAAVAWRTIPHEGWHVSWWWTALSAGFGLAAGVAFHMMDRANYAKAGATEALLSPTKLAHDFVAYPVLFGGLLCIGVPLLVYRGWLTWVFLGCIGLWFVFGVADMRRGLDSNELHPVWDVRQFAPAKQ